MLCLVVSEKITWVLDVRCNEEGVEGAFRNWV